MIGSTTSAWIVSSVLHALLLALLLFGPSIRPPARQAMVTGPVIEAVAIDALTLDLPRMPDTPPKVIENPVPDPVIKAADEQAALDTKRERERELEKQKAKEEAEAVAQRKREEEKKQAAIEAAANQKLADEKAADEARLLKERKIAEDKVRKDKLAREQKEAELAAKKKAEQKAIEVAAKKKAAEEKKKREAAERVAKKLAEEKKRKEALEAQMRAEQEAREKDMLAHIATEERRGQAVSSGLLARYQAEVVAKVTRNWNRPATANEGLLCHVKAVQIPGGEVISAEVLECNGDEAVKRSIESAVYKASPLPEPPDPTLFERNLIFIFAPE